MSIDIFLKSFYLCFLVLISVGPVFLTTANISMTRGCKEGFFAALGCISADILFIVAGAVSARAIVAMIPDIIMILLKLFAGSFLLYIAINFWRTDVKGIKARTIHRKNFALIFKMFCLTISSPISIIGYGAIFSQVIDSNTSLLSAIFGGIMASILTHSLIVCSFSTLGKKINDNILSFLNKFSALWIGGFAILLIVNFFKQVIVFIAK